MFTSFQKHFKVFSTDFLLAPEIPNPPSWFSIFIRLASRLSSSQSSNTPFIKSVMESEVMAAAAEYFNEYKNVLAVIGTF